MVAFSIILFLLLLPTIFTAYLLLLTVAAFFAPVTSARSNRLLSRFLILVPAHNEAGTLPACLESLRRLDYPAELFQVHVVADNCQDDTAEVARSYKARVHERQAPDRPGKGPALQWLLERLWRSGEAHDAVVFFDADTLISPNFLRASDARLAAGAKVLQAYYSVRDVERSYAVALRYAALAALHYLRPMGRMSLGGSAGLKGNGMVFEAEALRGLSWSESVTEDIQLHMDLLLDGGRVEFVPEAVVWGEMPESLERSRTQHARWETGRLELARRYVPILLQEAARRLRAGDFRGAFRFFDAAMEHVIPPLSVLVGASAALWGAALVLAAASYRIGTGPVVGPLFLSTAVLAGQFIYVLAGLRLAGAPGVVYRNLLFAPWLVLWKLGQYARIFLGKRQMAWVRTARNEG